MKLKSVLEVLATVAGTINPAVAAAIEAVNNFLPPDKKLPIEATGADVSTVIKALPSDMQTHLLETELELEVADSNNWTAVEKSLADADSKGASERPKIARMMAWCVVAQVACVILAAIAATFGFNQGMLELKTAWPLILVAMGTPIILLQAYFGLRTSEKNSRYAAATGQPLPPQKGLIGSIFK